MSIMKPILLLLAATLILASCTNGNKKPDSADLVILCTTDVHGACLPYDFKRGCEAEVSLANVSQYVKQERKANPEEVMLFDTGDFLQGQPSIYYYNFIDTTSQHLMARIFNYLGYDAIGVGNHDIETGEGLYNGRFPKMIDMPWLCANAIDTRTGQPMFQPYAVMNRKGIKIAVLGMITPNIHAWLPKSLWPNLEFEDMVECAQKWMPVIQEREHPDIVIGLFHAGSDYETNGNTADTRYNENGSIPAAQKVPGFDIIIIGHDHYKALSDIVNVAGDTVKMIDAATAARFIGRADIHLQRKSDGTYSKTIKTQLVDSRQFAPDTDFCAEFEGDIKKVNDYLEKPLGTLTADLNGIDGLYGPCKFMDLVHDAQLWATKADVSMAAVLSPYEEIPAGNITWRQLFVIYKYENQLFTLLMKGKEIQKYLEFGFSNQFATMRNANDPLINRDSNGKPVTHSFNYTSAAGIRYIVDISKPAGKRVTILSMSDGSAFDPDKDYKVAINSYQASGGGNFITEGLGWDNATLEAHTIDTTPIDVRSYIAAYIKEQGTITPHLRGDWQVIPKDLWEIGKAREIANDDRYFR